MMRFDNGGAIAAVGLLLCACNGTDVGATEGVGAGDVAASSASTSSSSSDGASTSSTSSSSSSQGAGGSSSSSSSSSQSSSSGGEGGDGGGGGGSAPTPIDCTGDDMLTIGGDYVAADGAQHWLRVTPTASTYTRIAAGTPAPPAPPILLEIERVCGDQRAFLVASRAGTHGRVDWAVEGAELRLCLVIEGAAEQAEALLPPLSDPASPTTGCKGGPWLSLTKGAE